MKNIDWEFELGVLRDCWSNPVFRWLTIITALVLVLLIASGHMVWWAFIVGFTVTFVIGRLGRAF